jgi:hypothetical protein
MAAEESMRWAPDFERLLSVILAEGQGCECPHRDTCGHTGEAWCCHVTKEGNSVRITDYRDLSMANCMYREQPGCCWVLAAVETLASDYLVRLGVENPPVPSELLSAFDDSRQIDLQLLPLKCFHGAAWLLGSEWVVQLNELDSPEVRRHTIFHEGFHIACRNASPAFKRVDLTYKPFRDVLADHFATAILMRKEWVEERSTAVQDVPKMARMFDVSASAMEHRLGQLGLIHRAQLRT